jgi:hypothetical protein
MIIPHRPIDYYREYYVSVWVGQFPSVEAVDAYFTEDYGPDHWKPSPFAVELGLGYYPPEYLEIHFDEETIPRPLLTLLMEASFSESFLHDAFAAARDQGIYEAQGIALLYNFDYQFKSDWKQTVGPMRFIGAFGFDPHSLKAKYHEVAEQAGCSFAALWFVLAAYKQFMWERRQEQGNEDHPSAREFCVFLQSAQGKTTEWIVQWGIPRRIAADLPKQGSMGTILRELGLLRSEDVGRVIYALANAGFIRTQESDSKADFHGLFNLEE